MQNEVAKGASSLCTRGLGVNETTARQYNHKGKTVFSQPLPAAKTILSILNGAANLVCFLPIFKGKDRCQENDITAPGRGVYQCLIFKPR